MSGPLKRAQPAEPHRHPCQTCQHYYVCLDCDCRDGWTCPSCEDDELSEDIARMEQELSRADHR